MNKVQSKTKTGLSRERESRRESQGERATRRGDHQQCKVAHESRQIDNHANERTADRDPMRKY